MDSKIIKSYEPWEVPSFEPIRWLGKTSEACIIIPVINEGDRIKKLLNRMDGLSKEADIIIVDGGSTDGSLNQNLLDTTNVRGVLLKKDSGALSAQLRCGYAFALKNEYRFIVTIDGNNKDDPCAIPQMIDLLKNGYDFVQASRFLPGGIEENTPLIRSFAIRCIHAPMLKIFSGFPWTDTTQGYRAYSNKLLQDQRVALFRRIFSHYEILPYMSYRAPKLGFKCIEVPSIRRYPEGAIPTKISKWKGNFSVFSSLVKACFGQLNP